MFLLPSIAYLFIPLTMPFAEHEFLVLMRSSFIIFFLLWIIFSVSCLRTLHQVTGPGNFLLCVLQKVLQFYTLHLNL